MCLTTCYCPSQNPLLCLTELMSRLSKAKDDSGDDNGEDNSDNNDKGPTIEPLIEGEET